MDTVTVYGASDDLIEIEGAICEEFDDYCGEDSDRTRYLAFSDGTIISVLYAGGVWKLHCVAKGSAEYAREENTGPDGTYTDKVTLRGEINWVVFGTDFRQTARPVDSATTK